MLGSIGDVVDADVSLVDKHDLQALSLAAEEHRSVFSDLNRANAKEPPSSGATEGLQELETSPNGLGPLW